MKKETAKTIAIALAMGFMFCLGSQMHQPIPLIAQTAVGVLMVLFSILARGKIRKASED